MSGVSYMFTIINWKMLLLLNDKVKSKNAFLLTDPGSLHLKIQLFSLFIITSGKKHKPKNGWEKAARAHIRDTRIFSLVKM